MAGDPRALVRELPAPLFRLLCASTLYGARISADTATRAARGLAERAWTTAERMAASTWEERTRALNQSGYARYDESTSRRLGAMAEGLLSEYRGDLPRLRAEAKREPLSERSRLRQFKGMGEVSVDIFSREVQGLWDELHPFLDGRARRSATRLGLPTEPEMLAQLLPRREFPRLAAALVRVDLLRKARPYAAGALRPRELLGAAGAGARQLAQVTPSPALSQVRDEPSPIAGRVVGALVGAGFDKAGLELLRQTLTAEGASLQVIAPSAGSVGHNGKSAKVDKGRFATDSVEFDALLVAGGSREALEARPKARSMLGEAFEHCKPLGAWGDGEALLGAAGIPADAPGVVVFANADQGFADQVVEALRRHRFWGRAEAIEARAREELGAGA